jgi:hypothetical protein
MLAEMWDFIDKRRIDTHIVSMAVLYGVKPITVWAMAFATLHPDSANSAMVIGAVTAPYMFVAGYTFKSYFDTRSP